MVLRPEVINAFSVLGVSPDTDETTASKAYKKLALEHHPDRNHGDSTATARFQEIGAAWDICARHYENPQWSQASERSPFQAGHSFGSGMFYTYEDDEDDDDMDEDERGEFFRYMFFQVFMGQYTHSKRQRFRSERHAGRGPSYTSYGYPFEPTTQSAGGCYEPPEHHNARQRKEKEEYEKRMREFEAQVAAEEREIQNAEREKKAKEEQRLSAQVEAFGLARAGDSAGVRKIIETHNLDVTSPERVTRPQKKTQSPNLQTLLHVAATSCNEELVAFLLEKGADISALNKERMTPFHQAILSGNTSVVKFLLTRRWKGPEYCHPSKAAADGRTPLQLAILRGDISTIELLLKDATVHDVERCWEQPSLASEIKAVLETKKGFVRRAAADGASPPISRKAVAKAKAACKLAVEQEEKAKRLAEERARAAENMRKKEERAAKRTEEERIAEETRRKLETEEHQKVEEETRIKLQERRRAEFAARKQVEQETLRRDGQAECRKLKEVESQRLECEARFRAEVEARRKTEEYTRRRLKQEEHRKVLEMESCRLLETEARQREVERKEDERQREIARQAELEVELEHQRELQRRQEIEYQGEEAEARQREAEEHQKAETGACAMNERDSGIQLVGRHPFKLRRKNVAPRGSVQDADAKRAETLQRLQAQAEEHERMKLQRQQEYQSAISQPSFTAVPSDPKMEAILRRRAEQSARDKARSRRLKEEKATFKIIMNENQPSIDTQGKGQLRPKKADKYLEDSTPPQQCSTYPLTPSSLSSSPLSWSEEPTVKVAPLTPPMTPEDMQTCTVPDDLFFFDEPSFLQKRIALANDRHALQSPSCGRGWRGRGCGGHSTSWHE